MLTGISLLLALVPACKPPDSCSTEHAGQVQTPELGAALDEAILNADDLAFSGEVLVADAGTIALSKSYGFIDSDGDCTVEHEASRWVASLSKQFCAAAIAALVSDGSLRFEDPLSSVLSNVPADKAGITIHQLLTHSSGLPNKYPGDGVSDRATALANVMELKLDHKPGKKYLYTNAGYQLLAMIVEEISHQSYEQFLRDRFFTPLAMGSTGSAGDGKDWRRLNIATSDRRDAPDTDDWSSPNYGFKGSGGVLTTVGDLYTWHQAIHSNRVFTPELTELLFTRHVDQGTEPPNYYGYGWQIFDTDDGEVIAHSGQDDFIEHNATLEFFRTRDLLFVILSDAGDHDDRTTSQAMLGRLIDVALKK